MRPVPDVADLVRFAIEAERAGLDAVMVSEHIVLGPSADAAGRPANPRDYALPGNQDPATPWPSPLVLLSAIAAATTRIRLVAGALISPLRHPLATAKDLATLDRLSGGRLVVQPTVSWHRTSTTPSASRSASAGRSWTSSSRSGPKPGTARHPAIAGSITRSGPSGSSHRRPAPVVRTCGSAVRACTPG